MAANRKKTLIALGDAATGEHRTETAVGYSRMREFSCPTATRISRKATALNRGVRHGMFAYDAPGSFGYVKKLNDYKMADIGPRITRDMLVIGAERGHFIAKELYAMDLNALPNVKSPTFRLMTAREDAGGRCNVGSPQSVPDTVADWLMGFNRRGGDGA